MSTTPNHPPGSGMWASTVNLSPQTRKLLPLPARPQMTLAPLALSDPTSPTSATTPHSVERGCLSSQTYKQAIVEIYEALYDLQRERTGVQEVGVVNCISKWYELNAVFENPFTRAVGVESIVNQFSLMSLIPGRIWSELGDVCESEDCNGHRVVVFSHTLHFSLLEDAKIPVEMWANTPYPSVPPTPFPSTPSLASRLSSMQSGLSSSLSLGPAAAVSHRLRVTQAGSGTRWPLSWLVSRLSPARLVRGMTVFDLKLSTRLEFNEQARIVVHEDVWGLKETLEFVAPSVLVQAYGLQRWLFGWLGDELSRRYINHAPRRDSSSGATRSSFSEIASSDAPLHAPILIGSGVRPSRRSSEQHSPDFARHPRAGSCQRLKLESSFRGANGSRSQLSSHGASSDAEHDDYESDVAEQWADCPSSMTELPKSASARSKA